MSNLVFPSSIGGYIWGMKKMPVFNNITHSPATGRDIRISLYDQPIFEFTLSNEWLTKADKDTLMGFFIARKGSFDSFLYLDDDSVITNEGIAIGDNVKTAFQLAKLMGGSLSVVNNAVGSPAIYINGVLKTAGTHYTISNTGLITTASPIPTGQVLSWSGSAYYRCVFFEDSLEFGQFATRLYDCGEIKFKGCMANKL
jgi:uncharacterized protein (TIGR02217 family)